MIIGVSDPDQYTFSQQLIDHWESLGHEVRKSMYHEEKFVEECDAVFYDFASTNVQQLTKFGKKPKRCVVRAIDVENYFHSPNEFNFDLIDSYLFLNKSVYWMMKQKGFPCPEEKVHIVPPGINLNKFTLRSKSAFKQKNTLKLVFVGRLWIGKNVLEAVQIAHLWSKVVENIELHIRGDVFDPPWWKKRVEHEISSCNFPIHFDERAENMNDYLEDKDVLLVPSFKEAFSYVTAEAMAKGIPVLTANWYGASEVWPEWMVYKDVAETLSIYNKIIEHRSPKELRQVVQEKYDEQIMFNKIDKLLL